MYQITKTIESQGIFAKKIEKQNKKQRLIFFIHFFIGFGRHINTRSMDVPPVLFYFFISSLKRHFLPLSSLVKTSVP